MSQIKKYLKVILGCLIIALSLNLFFMGNRLIPAGIFGFSMLFNYKIPMNLSLIVLLINAFFITLGFVTIDSREVKKSILSSLLIPLFIFLTSKINTLIDISVVDTFLTALYGGVLMGLGHRFIYKENLLVSGSDILNLIVREIILTRQYIVNYILDFCWIIFAFMFFGFEASLYSLICIGIIEFLSKRANLGISDAKVFYIITKKEKEIRKYIIEELHYELTMFDVKGGFLQTKNKVLMSVVPTKDYYKLKEGVKQIDPRAFISITDSYEVIKNND